MNLSKKLVHFLAFFISLCFARGAVNPAKSGKSGLIEAAVRILESCYGNRTTAVGLAGNSMGMISGGLWSRGIASVTLLDDTTRIVTKNSVNLQYKLQLFAVTASSPITLNKTLVEIKASIWWNHMADFLLLDLNHGCTNAYEMLWVAWKMNLLNAKFLCYHRTKGRLVYTFNPYTSHAPASWQAEKLYSGDNDHPWTLFVRVYENSEKVCNELDYDKTNDLGGYEIRVSVVDVDHVDIPDDHTNSDRICPNRFDEITCKIMFHALNATPNVKVYKSYNSLGYVDKKGKPTGILKELSDGLRDVGVTGRYLTSLGNLSHTYPHFRNGLRSLSQYTGYKSQLSKIGSVTDSSSRLSLGLVCLITVLFFKYFLRQCSMVAHLSTLRIICNSSLPKIPGKLAPRIYLGSLFLFALTMQGIYQGKLASLLTIQERLPNVDTFNDLVELDHTIYGSTSYHRYFTDPEFDGRFVEVRKLTCTEYVLRNPRAACICDQNIIVYDAVEHNLHMSSEELVSIWSATPIRPDWPLEHRLSMVLMTAVEALGMSHQYDNGNFKIYSLLKIQENRDEDQSAKVLSLEQLGFAFAILGIGLGCATISFIIEVSLGRNRAVTMKKRNRSRRMNYKISLKLKYAMCDLRSKCK